MKRKDYQEALAPMTEELVAMARWARVTGQRIVVVFEGRDTAGKGGTDEQDAGQAVAVGVCAGARLIASALLRIGN